MSILCRIGWHRWGKWTEYKRFAVQYRKTVCGIPVTEWEPYGEKFIQQRTCERCGQVDFQTSILKTTSND